LRRVAIVVAVWIVKVFQRFFISLTKKLKKPKKIEIGSKSTLALKRWVFI
jgi:hypothetical protein